MGCYIGLGMHFLASYIFQGEIRIQMDEAAFVLQFSAMIPSPTDFV